MVRQASPIHLPVGLRSRAATVQILWLAPIHTVILDERIINLQRSRCRELSLIGGRQDLTHLGVVKLDLACKL